MGIKDKLMKIRAIRDNILYRKYRGNIHDVDLTESVKTGIADRLMQARELDIPYCVIFGGVIPTGTSWYPYGNGDWNPPREYITTDDIKTEDKNKEQERQNVYAFLRGEEIKKEHNKSK